LRHKSHEGRSARTKLLFVEAEDRDGHVVGLELREEEICFDGFRKVRGEYFRGAPKRDHSDCFNYCKKINC
jgi:hypothetical protein